MAVLAKTDRGVYPAGRWFMKVHPIDKKKIREAVRLLLEAIGEDADRDGLRETPDRVARMYEEIFGQGEESPVVALRNMAA